MLVNLGEPARRRWHLSSEQIGQARTLFETYQRDLGLAAALVSDASRAVIPEEYWDEMEGLAQQIGIPVDEVVCGNLYYDAMKAVLVGCTAFAVDASNGPLHARNLDWHSENDALRRFTLSTRFVGGAAGEFTTVGWPGFVGVFSGVAPGRFSVTLNAAMSDEPLQTAMPVVFLLRQVLEQARDFAAAVRTLMEAPVASDSLLLVAGVKPGEMAVIERTPRRGEVRFAVDGRIFVTNHYRHLPMGLGSVQSDLQTTTCGRMDRISALVASRVPDDAASCLNYLSDGEVVMGTTVQQMVFQASTGKALVR